MASDFFSKLYGSQTEPTEPETDQGDFFSKLYGNEVEVDPDFLFTSPLQTQPETQDAISPFALPEPLLDPGPTASDRFLATVSPVLAKVFDFIDRGKYASANVMEALTNVESPATGQQILEAARSGATGERKGDYINLVRQWFPDAPEWWIVSTGFLLNILLDPTTYLSFGTKPLVGGTRALVRFAGKSLLPETANRAIFRTLDKAVDAIKKTPAGRWLTETFSTRGRFADEDLWRYYQQSRDETNYYIRQAIDANVPIEEAMRELEKRTGIPRDVLMDFYERPVYVETEELIQTTLPMTRQVTEELSASPQVIGRAEELIESTIVQGGHLPRGYTRDIGRIRTLEDVKNAEEMLLDLYMDSIADRFAGAWSKRNDPWFEQFATYRPRAVRVIRERDTKSPLWFELREEARRQLDAGEVIEEFPKEWADLWDTLRLLEDPEFQTTRIRTRTGPMSQSRLSMEVTQEVPVREPYSLGEYQRLVTRTPEHLMEDRSLRDFFQEWTEHSERRLQAEIAEGIPVERFKSDELNYIPHMLHPEARKFIQDEAKKGRTINIERFIDAPVRHGSTRERTIRDMTIREINELSQHGGIIPGFHGKLLIDDPVVANLVRDVMSARSIAAARFIRRVVDDPNMARPAAVAGPGFRELGEAAKERFGPLIEGVAFRSDIADALEEYIVRVSDPSNINAFAHAYDRFMNLWKAYTLGTSPPWMVNNVLGNAWNGVLLANANPEHFVKALNVLVRGEGTVAGKTASEIIDLAERHGIMMGGLYGGEIERALSEAVGRGGSLTKAAGALEAPLRPIFKANQALENWARLGLFIDGLEHGMSPADAASRVKKYLFDYTDLTDAERNIRRYIPFYTWMRKNIPLQVEAAITTPGRQAVLPEILNAIAATQDVLIPGEAQPEWMQGGAYPQVEMEDGVARFMSLRGIPLVDLISFFHDPTEILAANPVLSAIAAARGIDLYSGRELDPTKGVTVLPGVTLSEPAAEALFSLFPPLQSLSRVTAPYHNPLVPEKDLSERIMEFLSGVRTYERSYPQDLINAMTEANRRVGIARSRLTQAQLQGEPSQIEFYEKMLEEAVAQQLLLYSQLGAASSPKP